jgi:hypothetical protein
MHVTKKDGMSLFAVLDPFFHALSDGKLIRLTVAWVLRVLAVLMALAGLFWFVAFVRFGFNFSNFPEGSFEGRSAEVLIGFLLFALFGLAWGYLTAGILAFRARSVMELEDSHFTVLPILSLLFRLNGEMAFVTYALLGVGGCLFVWLTNFSPFSELGMLGERIPFAANAGSGFMGGLELAAIFLLLAFAFIIIFYALAELSVVLVEIALNTRGPRTAHAEKVPAQLAPKPTGMPSCIPAEPPFSSKQRVCKQCGQPLAADSTFCDECGTQVG